MEVLDGDGQKLKTTKKTAMRDIVQFVPLLYVKTPTIIQVEKKVKKNNGANLK